MGQTLGIASPPAGYNFQQWTSSDLDVAIDEVNHLCAGLASPGETMVQFKVVRPSHFPFQQDCAKVPKSGIMWRLTVQVQPHCCTNPGGKKQPCKKSLSLSNFVQVYQFIKESCDPDAASFVPPPSSSQTPQQQDRKSVSGSDGGEKCLICYESAPQEVLPCMHAFCESCVKEWSSINATCPLCREELPGERDRFFSVAKPSTAELNEYLIKSFAAA